MPLSLFFLLSTSIYYFPPRPSALYRSLPLCLSVCSACMLDRLFWRMCLPACLSFSQFVRLCFPFFSLFLLQSSLIPDLPLCPNSLSLSLSPFGSTSHLASKGLPSSNRTFKVDPEKTRSQRATKASRYRIPVVILR